MVFTRENLTNGIEKHPIPRNVIVLLEISSQLGFDPSLVVKCNVHPIRLNEDC